MGLLIDKIYWKIIWILTGLLFGIAGSLMIISGAFCADRFYDAGKVYDVEENGRKSCWNDTIHYDETTPVSYTHLYPKRDPERHHQTGKR